MKVTVFGGSNSNNSQFTKWDIRPYEDSSPLAEYLAAHPYMAVKENWFQLNGGQVVKVLDVSGPRYAINTTYISNTHVPNLRVLEHIQILWMHFYKVQLSNSKKTHWVPDFVASAYLQGTIWGDLID